MLEQSLHLVSGNATKLGKGLLWTAACRTSVGKKVRILGARNDFATPNFGLLSSKRLAWLLLLQAVFYMIPLVIRLDSTSKDLSSGRCFPLLSHLRRISRESQFYDCSTFNEAYAFLLERLFTRSRLSKGAFFFSL